MSDTISVPVSTVTDAADSALAVHEVLDDAAHVEIAQVEDEDYKWLTDRLDALSAEVANLRSSQANQYREMTTLLSSNQEQSRMLIDAQTRMIETLTNNLSALSTSALLTLTPNVSENLSQSEPIAETVIVTETEPVSAERTQEQSAESVAKKKRPRM